MAGDLRRGQRLLPVGPRKRQPAPARRAKSSRWPPSAPGASPGSTCSSFDGGLPRGPAGSRRAPAWRCSRAPVALQRTGRPDGRPAGAGDLRDRHPRRACGSTTPVGAMYVEYTYAPGDRILNGFIQALVGLYEYTAITKDPLGLRCSKRATPSARGVPTTTPARWSLYDQFGESDLNYHELLAEFLQQPLRTHGRDSPADPPAPNAANPRARPPRRRRPPAERPAPRAAPPPRRGALDRGPRRRGRPSQPMRGRSGRLHRRAALQRRSEDPPVIALLSSTLRARHPCGRAISLSKIAIVELRVQQVRARGVANRATVEEAVRGCCGLRPPAAAPSRSRSPLPTSRATSPPPAARSRQPALAGGGRYLD